MIYDITFLPLRKTMVKPATYHVDAIDNIKAVEIATEALKAEHNTNYYNHDRIVIKETRILR